MIIKFINSSLGRLFVLSVLLSTASLFVSIHVKWNGLISDVRLELSGINQILIKSASDRFSQQEIMFKILGQRLLELGGLDNVEKVQSIMDGLLQDNPVFVVYELAKPDGELVVTSLNLRNKELPNLLKIPLSPDSFKLALNSNELIIGRTYFFKPLMKWLIPAHYAVLNSKGEVAFVITSAFGLDSDYNPWSIKKSWPDIKVYTAISFGENKKYFPISLDPYSIIAATKEETYSKPLSDITVSTVMSYMEKVSGKPFQTLIKNDFTLSYVNETPDLAPVLTVVSYDKKYRYFLAVRQIISSIKDTQYLYVTIFSSIYIIFNLVFFFALYRMFITDEQYKKELKHQALHDSLTGLPNPYFLKRNYSSWVENRSGFYALLVLDLDNFKFINNHLGHSVGDQVLIKIAKRLKTVCSDESLIIRQGGDEFLVLIPILDQQALLLLIEKIAYRINEVMVVKDIRVTLTVSIGIACENQPNKNLENLMIKADIAMHQAKKTRNSFAIYTSEMQVKSDKRAIVETELHYALKQNEMFMVYQPQIDSESGLLIGVEALIRWQNPNLGFVPPDNFISVAEDSGEINSIGNFVIETAFKEISELSRQIKPIRLSINVSVQQLINEGFRDHLKLKLLEYQLDSANIVIEITESLFIEDFKHIDGLLTLIRNDGFSISLDDFGTGYSALSILRSLPINEIKVDKSFVQDILTNKQDNALIKSIVEIGKILEIPTLAEGVEEIEQAIMLRQLGCNMFQGYYFAKPMKIDALKVYIATFSHYEI